MRQKGTIRIAHRIPELTEIPNLPELPEPPDLMVIVPRRIGQEIEIVPVNMPEGIVENNDKRTENFTWIRSIANFALFRKDHHEMGIYDAPIKEFDPPIELRIPYGNLELKHVHNNVSQLKLAYWARDRWVIISDIFHEYQILPPNFAPIAEVKIWSWLGDPTLAWGK